MDRRVATAVSITAGVGLTLLYLRRRWRSQQKTHHSAEDQKHNSKEAVLPADQQSVILQKGAELQLTIPTQASPAQQFQRGVKVKEIRVYPIKSCKGISLPEAELSQCGILHDREFVVCGPECDVKRLKDHMKEKAELPKRIGTLDPQAAYQPVTLRDSPKLAWVSVQLDKTSHGTGLVLSAPGMDDLAINAGATETIRTVQGTPFGQTLQGQDCGLKAGEWFSRFLDPDGLLDLRLCLLRFTGERCCETRDGDLRYQDVAPLLVMTTSSINTLAHDQTLGLAFDDVVDRFRPNIIVETDEPYEEDTWDELEVPGKAKLALYRPCDRCQVPSVNHKTAKWEKDPCKSLRQRKGKQLRKEQPRFSDKLNDSKIYFGMYANVLLEDNS